MKIIVKEEAHNVRLVLPTGLLLNRWTVGIACREAKKYGTQISPHHMRGLFKVLKDYRRAYPDWVLAEVRGVNGEYVQIKL